MNHPISNFIPMLTTLRPALCIAFFVSIVTLIGGCGREDAAPEATPPSMTPTSSAILAATPTPLAEDGTVASDQGPTPQESALETATLASASNSGSDKNSEADEPEPSLSCDKEIALDLIGHPQYAELYDELGCPLDSASFEPVAINEFGPGPEFDRFMLWFSTTAQIYVLQPEQIWASFDDTWTEAEEEIQCNPTDGEMTSPPLPRRGFGKLWCANAAIQESMGMITREERLCQHSVLQEFENGHLLGCFEDATIRYIQLFSDNTWDMTFVQ